MNITYFNFSHHLAEGRWERSSFASKWWHSFSRDPHWVPPDYLTFRRELEPGRNPHLARMSPRFIYTTAMSRRKVTPRYRESFPLGESLLENIPSEQIVAICLVLSDPRRADRAAHLALLHCTNDLESLERLLDFAATLAAEEGCQRLLAPAGLSPHLGTGLLENQWNRLPSQYTPYNPPYLPELVSGVMEPIAASRLYHLDVPTGQNIAAFDQPSASRAKLVPFEPARLSGDLLPLLAHACPSWAGFPPLDREEAAFIIRWIHRWPLIAWLAVFAERPIGFVLLQPDLAPPLRRAKGGRTLFWRAWLNRAGLKPAAQGRILFGGVLPEWRGRGTGSQLLRQALLTAREQRWQTISIGPLPEVASEAVSFLEHRGALPQQHYRLYQQELG